MPDPQAAPISVSSLQLDIFEQMVRRTTNAQRLVKRAQIILEALKGTSNTKISQQQVDYETVRRWRDRWWAAESRLQAIEDLLTDEQRVRKRQEPPPSNNICKSWHWPANSRSRRIDL
jgi:hypothetical protein